MENWFIAQRTIFLSTRNIKRIQNQGSAIALEVNGQTGAVSSWEIVQPINKGNIVKLGTEVSNTENFIILKVLDHYQTDGVHKVLWHIESDLVKPVPFMAQPMCFGYQPARPWQVLQSTQLPWHHTNSFPSHRLKGITTNLALFWIGNYTTRSTSGSFSADTACDILNPSPFPV